MTIGELELESSYVQEWLSNLLTDRTTEPWWSQFQCCCASWNLLSLADLESGTFKIIKILNWFFITIFIKHSLNPIQDGLCRGCSRMGGDKKAPSLKSVAHICHNICLQWWNLAVIPYLKKIQKMYESRDTPLEFCWHQHFFTGNQQILLYQEIQI